MKIVETLSIRVPTCISIPMEMKKTAMNRSLMGSILWLISLLFLLAAIIMPIRNAPMAMDRPM